MRLLIKHDADVNEVLLSWPQWTPMHFAAFRGHDVAMDTLHMHGGLLEKRDGKGQTPPQLLEVYRAGAKN
jgi:hypothetical protein